MTAGPPLWKGTRGEWWVVGQAMLMAAVLFAPAAWRWSGPSRAVWVVPGVLLVVAGLGLAADAIRDLGASLSTFPKPRRRAVLVETGVYARTRHPMYGGLIIAAVGWALWRMSALHLLLAAVLALYMNLKAGREERFLVQRFPEYASYRARTHRLIPRLF